MIICMAIGTALAAFFLLLTLTAAQRLNAALLQCLKEQQIEKIETCRVKIEQLVAQARRGKEAEKKKLVKKAKKVKKELDAAKKQLDAYQKGKISVLELVPLAGYRFIQLMKWDYSSNVIKELNKKCVQFKEKKQAMNYTYYLLGSLYGYMVLAACAFFILTGLGLALELGTRAFVVGGAAFIVFALFGYVPYDNVNSVIKKRKEEIERQFPQVVSKLSLLTIAGMEVSQAWELASHSGTGTLYEEMGRVLIDFNNNVAPQAAYTKFLTRCNNKYTTKLATAILQNMSKGNSEIVKLFRSLNDESWMEHKHNAKRMGEKIQSRLLAPTLLMFLGIIILVTVPVMSGFNVM